jgi:cytochrome P450
MADMREYARSMSTVRHALEKDPAAFERVHMAVTFADADFVLRSREFTVLTAEDGYGRDVGEPILGDTLSRVDGPAHFDRRRIEAALFRSPALRSNEAGVLEPALERVLGELRAAGSPVRGDLHDISEEVLGENVAALIGLDGLDTPAGRRKFDAYYQDIDNGVRITWASAEIQRLADIALVALNRLVDDFIRPSSERRAAILRQVADGTASESAIPVDLLTLMLQHHESYGDVDANLMAREVALFITASITTLTNQVCYCVHHIEEWTGTHPEDAGQRTDVRFLSRALQESIRLHAGPVLMRKATNDQVLPSGEAVPAGHYAWVGIRQASQDTSVFGADAAGFNPWREVPAAALPYGVEFGIGRHACIGKRFAIGDDPDASNALTGAGILVMRRLYQAGMRLDPGFARTFVPELLDVHASMPIVLTDL